MDEKNQLVLTIQTLKVFQFKYKIGGRRFREKRQYTKGSMSCEQ